MIDLRKSRGLRLDLKRCVPSSPRPEQLMLSPLAKDHRVDVREEQMSSQASKSDDCIAETRHNNFKSNNMGRATGMHVIEFTYNIITELISG